MAIGSHTLSHAGAIVARLSSIEELAGMNMLCSDKTGTLTMNKMVIQEETPIYEDGLVLADVLKYAALAAKWHEPPKDALDTLVLGAVNMASLERYEMVDCACLCSASRIFPLYLCIPPFPQTCPSTRCSSARRAR